MVVRLQIRHDTKQNWEKYNPILASGEMGVETNNANITNRIKVGDGQHKWTELNYIDEKFVHLFGDETIKGDKTFNGILTVAETINGTVTKAVQDDEGNKITDTYQKLLAISKVIDENTDWNDITETGVYAISLNTWSSAEYYHSPNAFDEGMDKLGILVVFTNSNNIIQLYYPTSNYPAIFRKCVEGSWGEWGTFTANDNTIVRVEGDQEIQGEKTFLNPVKVKSGDIIFPNTEDCNLYHGDKLFIKKTVGGDVFIYGGLGDNTLGSITLFPNGATSNISISIDSNGLIDGKINKDSEGNIISETYVNKGSIDNIVLSKCLPATILERQPIPKEQNEQCYNELQEMLQYNKVGDFTDVISDTISIPYSLTTNGIKIVYGYNVAPLDECINKYGTGNYFVYDDTNETFTVPVDTPDGHCITLGHYRNGINSYEFNTNLECTQTGACEANTPVTFLKPFADANYALSCPYSAKSATGFTPTTNCDFIAKGRIKLSDVMEEISDNENES